MKRIKQTSHAFRIAAAFVWVSLVVGAGGCASDDTTAPNSALATPQIESGESVLTADILQGSRTSAGAVEVQSPHALTSADRGGQSEFQEEAPPAPGVTTTVRAGPSGNLMNRGYGVGGEAGQWVGKLRVWYDGRVNGLQVWVRIQGGMRELPRVGVGQGRIYDLDLTPEQTLVGMAGVTRGNEVRALRLFYVGVDRHMNPFPVGRPQKWDTPGWSGERPNMFFDTVYATDTGYPFEEINGFWGRLNPTSGALASIGVQRMPTPNFVVQDRPHWAVLQQYRDGPTGSPNDRYGTASSGPGNDNYITRVTIYTDRERKRITGILVRTNRGEQLLGHSGPLAKSMELGVNHAIWLAHGDFQDGYLRRLSVYALPVTRDPSVPRPPGRSVFGDAGYTMAPHPFEYRSLPDIRGEPIMEIEGFTARWDDHGITSFGVVRGPSPRYTPPSRHLNNSETATQWRELGADSVDVDMAPTQ